MNEEFLHFIFRNRLWDKDCEFTTDNDKIEIIDTGIYNNDSGPDFFNAKIKINNTIWAGNIEIHINASDWYKHKHQKDLAYGNVILHIVFNNDKPIYLKDNSKIPCWEIKFPHIIYNKYAEIKNNEKSIPCADYIDLVESETRFFCLERMAIERLETKIEYLENIAIKTKNNIENLFYISLARSFGFGINSEAFQSLAFSLPLNLLLKYKDDILKIQALLFGQAGFLTNEYEDTYVQNLKKEYNYLSKLHELKPINKVVWKKSKMRPSNFPHFRIAQFSLLILNFQELIACITNPNSFKNSTSYFDYKLSGFWAEHYNFETKTKNVKTKLGKTAINTIEINTIIPFVYFYFTRFSNLDITDDILAYLQSIPAENNRETREWEKINFSNKNAYESQALLHLKKEYCNNKKCHKCAIGLEIMKKINQL